MLTAGFLLSLSCKTLKDMTNLQNPSETWKPVVGYETLYEVSTFGQVKALPVTKKRGNGLQNRGEVILKHSKKRRGYLQVTLHNTEGRKRYIGVHQLVALAFIPNPDNKPTVNHKDGNKGNNYLSNLEWATHKEQTAHADINGLRNIRGEHSKKSKLNSETILLIRAATNSAGLAELYGVNKSTIYKIRKRETWKHL